MTTIQTRNLLGVAIFMLATSSFASRQETLDCQVNPAISLSVRTNGEDQVFEGIEQLSLQQLGNPHYANVSVGDNSLGIVSYSRSVGGKLISIGAWQTVLNVSLKPQAGSEIIPITEKQKAFTIYQGKIKSGATLSDVVCTFQVHSI